MSYHSKSVDENRIRVILSGLRASSMFSSADNCHVAVVTCQKCGKLYQEEIGEASAKVCSSVPFLCISCDGPTSDCRDVRLTFDGIYALLGLE